MVILLAGWVVFFEDVPSSAGANAPGLPVRFAAFTITFLTFEDVTPHLTGGAASDAQLTPDGHIATVEGADD
jgi:hypothetical protein